MQFLTSSITGKVPAKQQLDNDRLLSYLRSNVEVFHGCSSIAIKKFSYGQSNPTYSLETNNKNKFVLRKKPSGKLLSSAHAIDREYFVMSALQNSEVPVPRTYHFCKDPSIIGTPFYICEFVDGIVFTDCKLEKLKPLQRFAVYHEVNRVLANIHSIDLSIHGLTGYSKSKNIENNDQIGRLIYRWTKQFNDAIASGDSSDQDASVAMKSFAEGINGYTRKDNFKGISCLIHGDYKFDNFVFDPKTLRLKAVLDWELSTIGNPFTDLATFGVLYHTESKSSGLYRGGLRGYDLATNCIPDERSFVRAYIQNLDYKCALNRNFSFPIQDWNFYLSLNLFRSVGIFQGIVQRIKRGNASNAKVLGTNFIREFMLNSCKLGVQLLNEKDSLYDAMLEDTESNNALPQHLEAFRDQLSPKFYQYRKKLLYFMEAYCYPMEKQSVLFHSLPGNKWKWDYDLYGKLQAKARELGLWNLFLPHEYGHYGAGLTNIEYAPLCEIMGKSHLCARACNCSAPDTGNMEVFAKYGSEYQKKRWLEPLLEGKIRSCFGMTEPAVASSDARNISCEITRSNDGQYYVVNGRKWWTSNAMHPLCKVCILMGKVTNTQASNSDNYYQRQTMLAVPMDMKGVRIVRHLKVFGYDHAPSGHAEVVFDNVRVPAKNLILGEGKGFEISQGRLGPGRIHHCMRQIGVAERCLTLMKNRCVTRYAFNHFLHEFTSIQQDIANSRCEIEQSRLLTLQTAVMMDKLGNKKARSYISMIKVVAPNMCLRVIDRAIQAHGGMGVCQDTVLAHLWASARTIRLADGPDAVHQRVVARLELRNAKL